MSNALIIGYGNPLRGDDGLGWQAAQQIGMALPDAGSDIITCHQLTPELAEPISRAATVIFIDAARVGPPGQFSCQLLAAGPASPGAFSHYLTPALLLTTARLWYAGCPEAFLLSVSGAFFGYAEHLSPEVQAALPSVVTAALTLLRGRTACA